MSLSACKRTADIKAKINKRKFVYFIWEFVFWLIRANITYLLTFYTGNNSISLQRRSAPAGGSVIPTNTICTNITFSWSTDWLTFFSSVSGSLNVVTFLISGTFIVGTTSSLYARKQRIALKSRWTNTNCCMEVNLTKGSSTTLSG